jgi:hypothetical protein
MSNSTASKPFFSPDPLQNNLVMSPMARNRHSIMCQIISWWRIMLNERPDSLFPKAPNLWLMVLVIRAVQGFFKRRGGRLSVCYRGCTCQRC